MKSKYIIISIICLFIIGAGVCYSFYYKKNDGQEVYLLNNDTNWTDNTESPDDEASPYPQDNEEPVVTDKGNQEPLVYVHVCGAVVNPGVYVVKSGTRIVDLIDAAGGLTSDAAGDYINQAMEAADGQRIYIPTKDELKGLSLEEYVSGDNNDREDKTANKKVNLNTADEAELMSLPGIGQAKAKSIIEYRKKNGSFKDAADLMNIPGIKEGLLAKIVDLVIVK